MAVTLVTTLEKLSPRRSLVAAISWLVIALAVCFAFAASFSVGNLARDNLVQQRARRLARATDQLGSDLAHSMRAMLSEVRLLRRIQRRHP